MTRCVPSARPGFVRYEMEDDSGVIGTFELREDRAHDDFELYVRAFLRHYPPRLRRDVPRLVP